MPPSPVSGSHPGLILPAILLCRRRTLLLSIRRNFAVKRAHKVSTSVDPGHLGLGTRQNSPEHNKVLCVPLQVRRLQPKRRAPLRTPSAVAEAAHQEPLGYDLRRGASAYAPIIGGIGGFVVPTVVLIFEIASTRHGAAHSPALGRSTSLLVLGLIACLLGAFAIAAIGAERRLTPNLTAATLYAGASTAIGVVAIIAAFEALAQALLPATKELFVWITAGSAIGGSVLVALILGDAWSSAPEGHWLRSRHDAYRWAVTSSAMATVALLGATLAYFMGAHLKIDDVQMHWIVGIGIVLVLVGALGSMFRTMHPLEQSDGAITKVETRVVLCVLVTYLAVLVLVMP